MKEAPQTQAHTEVPADAGADAHGHDGALYHDPAFWVAMGFVGFLYVLVRYAIKPINAALDARAAKIKDQLEQAAQLKAQAQALLVEYEKQKKAAAKEAKAIVETAKKDAQDLRTKAVEELQAALTRRTQQAEEKIARAQADATRAIREQIVTLASEAAREVVAARLKNRNDDPAVTRAVAAISTKIA